MRIDLSGILTAARELWRRDRALLWPLSGLLVFVPQWAILLLVPPRPEIDAAADVEALSKALEPWIAAYGGWYVLAALLGQFGAVAIVSLYMPPVATAGAAVKRAAWRFPRALLAGLLVSMPCGALLLAALSTPLLAAVVMPGIVYLLGRTALANPVILAEPRTGAIAALGRSWRLTAGHGLPIAAIVGAIMLGGQLLGAMLVALDSGLRGGGMSQPVVLAAIDALAAGVAWVAGLALALVQVVLYRRLAR